MIITIDGPTASGKSTLARTLAYSLSYYYLNSGLLYRGLSYIILNEKKYPESFLLKINYDQIKDLLNSDFEYFYDVDLNLPPEIIYNSKDITGLLKTPEIDRAASIIATNEEVRKFLLEYQIYIASDRDIVADGRDCGTVVFPDAQVKIYLTASPEVRAKRWQLHQLSRGKNFSVQESLEIINQRDERDFAYQAKIKRSSNTVIIDNSDLDVNQTLEYVQEYILGIIKEY